MEYKFKYSKNAEKYLDSQAQAIKERIMDAVDKLPDGDVKKLSGRDGYRLVVGGFRVLFEYVDKNTIRVTAIGPRGGIYK